MTCKQCDDWGYLDHGSWDGIQFCPCAAGQWARANGVGSIKTPQAIAEIAELRRAQSCQFCGGYGWRSSELETCPECSGSGLLEAA